MKADAFFERCAKLLSANLPLAADGPMVAKLKQLGIVPGRPFAFANLDPDVRQALERGREQGQRQLLAGDVAVGEPLHADLEPLAGQFHAAAESFEAAARLSFSTSVARTAMSSICPHNAVGCVRSGAAWHRPSGRASASNPAAALSSPIRLTKAASPASG